MGKKKKHGKPGLIPRLKRKAAQAASAGIAIAGAVIAIGAVAAPAAAAGSSWQSDPLGALGQTGQNYRAAAGDIVLAGAIATGLVILARVMSNAANGKLV